MNRRLIIAAACAGALLTGCSGDAGDGDTSGDTSAQHDELPEGGQQDLVSPRWAADISPVSDPVVVGKTVAVVVEEDMALEVRAYDTETGKALWSKAAHPSLEVPGVPPPIDKVDGMFAFSEPDNSRGSDVWASRLVLVDPDGKVVSRSPAGLWDGAEPCGTRVCSSLHEDGKSVRYALDAKDDALVEDTSTPGGAWSVGGGLHMVQGGEDEPDTFYRIVDGKEQWSATSEELVSPDTTSRFGWSLTAPAPHVITMSLGHRGNESLRPRDWRPLGTGDLQVGIDQRTGKRQWQRKGFSNFCAPDVDLDAWPIRCRVTGEGRTNPSTQEFEARDTKVTFEGFDPATGTSTWVAELGGAEEYIGEQSMVAITEEWIAVPTDSGPRALNMATGEVATPSDDIVGACTKSATWTFAEPYTDDPDDDGTRTGAQVVSPCTADGDTAEGKLPQEALSHVGTQAGDLTFVVTEGGLLAYPSSKDTDG